MIARFDKANGILPQLMENKDFSDDVLPSLRQSSRDLRDILQKINSSKGTAGMLVNDPTLYKQLTGFMDNGGGWGIQFINGFYNLTHPLGASVARSGPAAGNDDGVAGRIVQLATGADHGVGGDSGNCGTAVQHCKFVHDKVTITGETRSLVGDVYAILARYEA